MRAIVDQVSVCDECAGYSSDYCKKCNQNPPRDVFYGYNEDQDTDEE